MSDQRNAALEALSPRVRGLLADLLQPMCTSSKPIYDLPNCTRHWYRAHHAFPGMRGRCALSVDQMIVLNGDVRDVLAFLGITPEWIRQQLAGRSPSDVEDPLVTQSYPVGGGQ
ncbi:hypothetical protein [uncultured Salinicola sp.]|uniref:hypothetical protein n=1 Tax=uncultured Salinicola sp. TaxID=1193542 RepID=UPI0026074EF2|nr:hypothetical protein [uncultured Salinicola sp.]|tara:strand:+ start:944 stop:1285 length:342 start_codon:yes stop_codon:yes gene_type:complete